MGEEQPGSGWERWKQGCSFYAQGCHLRELVSLKISTYISYGLGHQLQDFMFCPCPHIYLMCLGHHLPSHTPFHHHHILQGKNRELTEIVRATGSLHTQDATLIFKKFHYWDMWKNRLGQRVAIKNTGAMLAGSSSQPLPSQHMGPGAINLTSSLCLSLLI